jgi:3-phytase
VTEGCVADNELGNLYLAEERVGVWRFDAEPDGSNRGELVAKVGEHGLTGDVEGLTLYCARGGAGYLIASSQGNSVFNVYTRGGDHHYVLTIDPQAGEFGDVEHSDGVAVTSCPTSRRFPSGLLVAHDGDNEGRNQNFKLFGWEDIAGSHLIVDTHWSPRAPAPPAAVALAGDDVCSHAGSNEPLLETASACLAAPGALTLGVGFEQGSSLHRHTESMVPFTLDYAATHWLELVLEPIVYSRFHQPGRTLATGSGDMEVSAIVAPFPGAWRRSVALGMEVKLPTAEQSALVSESPEYTWDLILSQPVASLETHVNLGYTIVGQPTGSHAQNVYSFAFAAVRPFSRFDLVGEVFGHTAALAGNGNPAELDGTGSDLASAELVGTLGGRLHLGERATIGLGVSYDQERTFLVSPLLSLKLR